MASKVAIFNSALGHLGLDPVTSPDENNKRARIMNSQYEISRVALLRAYVWNFAKERLTLAADATDPTFGFDKRFLLPSRILKFIGVYDESELGYQVNYTGARLPHKIEGRYVLCDETVLRCFGVQDIADPTQFDPLFTYSLTWMLARDTSLALTNEADKFVKFDEQFRQSITAARTANAMEGTPEQITISEWEDARYGHGDGSKYGPRGGPAYW